MSITVIVTCKACKGVIPGGFEESVLEKETFHMHHEACLPEESRATKAQFATYYNSLRKQ